MEAPTKIRLDQKYIEREALVKWQSNLINPKQFEPLRQLVVKTEETKKR